ncbi:aminotransferase class I/II-fold pyridoxal phosphate-dependent enzyme [Psittacicella hinzii]|uniref:Aminotransferase class I/classII large domain-containing protein n=1 Tax=Psittacicella hinzii TaxID=2028575 RepID=A0A3A1YFJ8_9GAMM|nr:aminotransferase class I/II-fold pyridoxal phosphate-dependent enzyme [Psittacicella hinzii]RIY36216.1 hypothetical protein CKF58_06135 [Psittacicella hinzii]
MSQTYIKQAQDYLENLRSQNAQRTLQAYTEDKIIYLNTNDYLGIAKLSANELYENYQKFFTNLTNYKVLNNTKQSLLELTENFNSLLNIDPLTGSTGSRLLSGSNNCTYLVEQFFSIIVENDKRALYYNSGYHANLGIIPSLARLNKKTAVVMDRLAHASIIDGVRLADVNFYRFSHNNVEDLKRQVSKAIESGYQNIILCVESIYSMDGDCLTKDDFLQIIELKNTLSKQNINLIIYVDEAHAFGIYGAKKLGLVEEYGLVNDIDLIVCPVGKALNSTGAIIFAHSAIIEYLINTSRTFIYSTALPPAVCFKTLAAYLYVLNNELLVVTYINKCKLYKQHLENCISQLQSSSIKILGDNHIISIVLNNNYLIDKVKQFFLDHSIVIAGIKHPTVPKGSERIRLSLTIDDLNNDVLLDRFTSLLTSFIESEISCELTN